MDSSGHNDTGLHKKTVAINPDLRIPVEELLFRFSRSSGPGGQNVNKVNTRVTLIFDVTGSPSLTPEQRDLIRNKLGTRINKQGRLQVTSYRHRTQGTNRAAATERFIELLKGALQKRKPRKKTRVSRAARERRLQAKKQRGRLKQTRGAGISDQD
ncbi:MAG: aminoacyl-tRNA hydrolase [Desulfobacterales bacterium]|nr:aminoacyl-tRNA hydrolase [Desulfobacterales bacterium]